MIMNSYVTFHDLWIHIWIHVYEEYREIIPEFMCTKVPDEQPQRRGGAGQSCRVDNVDKEQLTNVPIDKIDKGISWCELSQSMVQCNLWPRNCTRAHRNAPWGKSLSVLYSVSVDPSLCTQTIDTHGFALLATIKQVQIWSAVGQFKFSPHC